MSGGGIGGGEREKKRALGRTRRRAGQVETAEEQKDVGCVRRGDAARLLQP